MSTVVKRVNGDLLIDLKEYNTFKQIKEGLVQKLRGIDDYLLGTMVKINLGDKHLSSKQVREIEDILLDHGLHLKELMSNGPPLISEDMMIEDMPDYEETALLCRNLRSGQKMFTEGNIVILGDVNPGAEVVAGGNILIMGSLRGMAHAGAFGDDRTIVAAYRLNPTQLRIANHITRPPDGEVIVVATPEVARIRAGKVIIEKLKI
ncbi:septum site-determining protein MinC [Syntrophomonas erecta]